MKQTLTQFRARLSENIDAIRTGAYPIVIYRHGRPAAALVSLEDWERIAENTDEILHGPIRARSGIRMGRSEWRKWRKKFGFLNPEDGGYNDGKSVLSYISPTYKEQPED